MFSCLRSPARLQNLAAYALFRNQRTQQPRYLPFALDVEPTTFCNFRCTMCHVSDVDFVHRHMPLALFQHIIDTNPQLLKIHLQGMGEPLLCPDFFAMAAYARGKGILVQTTTNASQITAHSAEQFAQLGFSSIGISVDGATAETFEKIRVRSNFQRVTQGITTLIATLQERKSATAVRAWTVVQEHNHHELVEIVELAHSLGFSALTLQVFVSSWGKQQWVDKNSSKTIVDFRSDATIQKALQRGVQLKFPVSVFTGNLYSPARPCLWPWYSAYIGAGGEMIPCCILGDAKVKTFGTISAERSLRDIWYSDEYQQFRMLHQRGTIPGFCEQCYR